MNKKKDRNTKKNKKSNFGLTQGMDIENLNE